MNKSDEPIVLRIYQARSGKWAGRLMLGSEKLADIAWFASPSEVEKATNETGLFPKHVVIEVPCRSPVHLKLVR